MPRPDPTDVRALEPRAARRAPWLAAGWVLSLVMSAPACLVDLDDRCGNDQHYDAESETCLCNADFERAGDRCAPCAENEMGSAEGCVCVEGFSRSSADSECKPAASLGQDCDSDADCGEDFGYCAPAGEAEHGYCTAADCMTAADCPTDYGCNTRQSPSFCERPPEGLGTPCKAAEDCAGFVASYCETVSAGACLVNDCAPDPDKCHGDWVCCDIGLLSQSLCIPPSELEDGQCPVGGTLVPRKG
jgi:hypothetical protein